MTSPPASVTTSQSIPCPSARRTWKPRSVRGSAAPARSHSGRTKTSTLCSPVTVNERRDGMTVEILDARADERKPFGREIPNGRRIVEPRGQPRLHGVLVRRGDLDQLLRERRADVRRHGGRRDVRVLPAIQRGIAREPRDHGDGAAEHGADGDPLPAMHRRISRRRRCGGTPRHRHDFRAQALRRGETGSFGADSCLQRASIQEARRTGRARRQMAADRHSPPHRKLAIGECFDTRKSPVTFHDRLRVSTTSCTACSDGVSRSMARPRASRDIMVPTGTPTTLAISR